MSVREEFDAWAAEGRDKGMEDRHWHTAKQALARMPVEAGDTVLDLGTGSGYATRALRERDVGRAYGLDGAPEMARNARSYTDDGNVGFVVGDFGSLPFADDSIDHAFSMEAFYYSDDPIETLEELRRVLRPGGTFYCAVDFFEENTYSHGWQDTIEVDMTLWSKQEYRDGFRDAGFYVAEQDNLADRDVEIPPASEFPTEHYDTREDMVERYRVLGTLLTVGVAPE
ncbi:class I SAM-dependent methyltransferase [Halocalculus aciditolerans]|uniref:SAM-dependent methyltransferase n=1 Tax=Halocalculus aciditolerans TaxID=1383812 RepID=A0A830F788_9EURY|nr:class I SAM-dependent methyltransferase [Halocalculus aciditolerans]GGL46177.1 SAM-dependent methyltransferase [Halocalculus aciditolerans]